MEVTLEIPGDEKEKVQALTNDLCNLIFFYWYDNKKSVPDPAQFVIPSFRSVLVLSAASQQEVSGT